MLQIVTEADAPLRPLVVSQRDPTAPGGPGRYGTWYRWITSSPYTFIAANGSPVSTVVTRVNSTERRCRHSASSGDNRSRLPLVADVPATMPSAGAP